MATVIRIYPDVLSPEDIRVAASAYESTLNALEVIVERDAAREPVARYIMEHALQGERDPIRLREGALAQIRTLGPTKKA